MNIVFLDVDGVLNSLPYCEMTKGKEDGQYHEIDESKLLLLKRIIEENDAHIVLSSTWRDLDHEDEPEVYVMWQYLVNSLAKYGMTIMSKTPLLTVSRPLEIRYWLETQPNFKDIKWISIEDDYDEGSYVACGIGGHLIHTKFFTHDINEGGLQERHVEMARQLFERQ